MAPPSSQEQVLADIRVRRSNRWFVILLVLMFVGGICAVGFWMTYDLKCNYGTREWTFNKLPPQFVCPSSF